MSLISPGKDPLTEARLRVEAIRRTAREGDVRGQVGALLMALSQNCISLTSARTSKGELASLIRFGLLSEAESLIATAKARESRDRVLSDPLIAKALEAARAFESLSDGHSRGELQQIPYLVLIAEHAAPFIDAQADGVPDEEGASSTGGDRSQSIRYPGATRT